MKSCVMEQKHRPFVKKADIQPKSHRPFSQVGFLSFAVGKQDYHSLFLVF